MSGGVDSSVAAALLLEAGHDVVGATLKLWGGESDSGCCSVADVDDARWVARRLGIEHHVFNFGDDFDEHVVAPYVADHAAGRTPNPCIECNRHLKFDRLLRRADALGFDAVATGHHARIVERADGSRRVARGADRAKDQSYVVHMLDQATLARTRFPVGHLTKAEVRAHAARLGLATADKPDSQDVCFITATGGRTAFLEPRLETHPGTVVDRAGEPVGHVRAVELVTIGQRHGLGLPGGTEPALRGRRRRRRRHRHRRRTAPTCSPTRSSSSDLDWVGGPRRRAARRADQRPRRPARRARVDGAAVRFDEPGAARGAGPERRALRRRRGRRPAASPLVASAVDRLRHRPLEVARAGPGPPTARASTWPSRRGRRRARRGRRWRATIPSRSAAVPSSARPPTGMIGMSASPVLARMPIDVVAGVPSRRCAGRPCGSSSSSSAASRRRWRPAPPTGTPASTTGSPPGGARPTG